MSLDAAFAHPLHLEPHGHVQTQQVVLCCVGSSLVVREATHVIQQSSLSQVLLWVSVTIDVTIPRCCLLFADDGANPGHIAADLLSQAEHGPDSQVVLLALPGVDLDAVQLAVQKQCEELLTE